MDMVIAIAMAMVMVGYDYGNCTFLPRTGSQPGETRGPRKAAREQEKLGFRGGRKAGTVVGGSGQ